MRSNITTIVPVHNGEKYIRDTLRSVFDQSLRPDRVLVLDNASTDKTPKICADFPGVLYYRIPYKLSMFDNFNRCLQKQFYLLSDYLHIIHADDCVGRYFYENVAYVSEDDKKALIVCGTKFIDGYGDSIAGVKQAMPSRFASRSIQRWLRYMSLLPRVYCSSFVIKCGMEEVRTTFDNTYKQVGDLVFWATLAKELGQVRVVKHALCSYRIHEESVTAFNSYDRKAMIQEEWKAMIDIGKLFNHGLLWHLIMRLNHKIRNG